MYRFLVFSWCFQILGLWLLTSEVSVPYSLAPPFLAREENQPRYLLAPAPLRCWVWYSSVKFLSPMLSAVWHCYGSCFSNKLTRKEGRRLAPCKQSSSCCPSNFFLLALQSLSLLVHIHCFSLLVSFFIHSPNNSLGSLISQSPLFFHIKIQFHTSAMGTRSKREKVRW